MRKLKFRAWDTTNKKMYDRVLAGPGDPCSIVWDEDRHEWVQFDDACGVIMQYTGLIDSNGVEIYEGDIVSTGHATDVVEWIEAIDTDRDWQHCTGFLIHLLPMNITYKYSQLNVKVIGNVYEHPHLIPNK
jgi:uncharacterized phage protein (TIGR01671 family)